MATINFTVEDHSIRVDNLIELAQGSNNFDTCAFSFDSTWDGFTLYAVMYQNPKNVFKLPLDEANTRKIPVEVLQKDGWVYIGARGEKEDTDETIVTSIVVKLPVRKGAVNGNETGQEMLDQSQYEYLLGKVNELNEKCESLTKELEEDISQLSEEKVSNPITGEVGQILEIETVDENGKPKSYKAVDKPTGGDSTTGTDGKDGFSPIATVTQTDTGAFISIQDAEGTTTAEIFHGKNGEDGHTPVKGTDYYTTEDKNEMVNLVLDALPTWTGGSY